MIVKISEHINREKEKMRSKTPKERLEYFWDYHKWYLIIGLIALVMVGYTIMNALQAKEPILTGILIDGTAPLEQPVILQSFCETNGFDPDKQEIVLNTGISLKSDLPNVNAAFYQRIHAGIGAGDTDFLVGYDYAIGQCAYDPSHMITDLRNVFTPEELAGLEAYLYYIDGSVWDAIKQSPAEDFPIPDPHKPEEMGNPIPVALDISSCDAFASAYYSPYKPVYLAVAVNAPHKETVASFIGMLLS